MLFLMQARYSKICVFYEIQNAVGILWHIKPIFNLESRVIVVFHIFMIVTRCFYHTQILSKDLRHN
jgi:hypothetical protein